MVNDYIRNLTLQKRKLFVTENIHWKNESISMKLFPFKRLQRLTPVVTGNLPLNYFLHILTDDIINEIIIHTNNYGVKMMKRSEIIERYHTNSWKAVTKEEILVFFGLIFYMGLIKLDRTSNYWNESTFFFGLNMFAMKMDKNRFLLLVRALHFAEYQDEYEIPPADQLYKIRNILNLFNRRMSEIYHPGREIIFDESFILFKGKLILRQYVTDKRHKSVGKVYTIATPTGIVLKCLMHMNILDDYDENKNCKKVMDFLDGYLNVGHSVYMDNYYNSFELVKLLAKNKTHCTGFLRKNRKTLPEEVVKAVLMKGETICRYANGVMIGKWKDTRDFIYISNEYKNDMTLIKGKRKEMKFIPLPIKQYNMYTGGIDKQEQLLSYYPLEKKNIKWPVKLFIHLLQIIIENARHLYNMFSLRDMSLYDFRLSIISSLLNTSSYCPELVSNKSKVSVEHVLIKSTPLKRQKQKRLCQKCYKRQKPIYICTVCEGSPTYCIDCLKIIHEIHVPNLPVTLNGAIENSLSRQGLLEDNQEK
ncbi:PREDICTED: piggyBac transposable element-derived protein 4-like isoform X1 [Polistes canadensis]|uniref:piggyBac transposable element-derived protein 4-like isoform X1 n=1 Tax=Polistes canadensis TaxID=91411 RepID=UPI000718E414|nr:PREDICTED: piggyBac transposable element-derived protein 4-like isoform X1 [Polistes canadensis]